MFQGEKYTFQAVKRTFQAVKYKNEKEINTNTQYE